MNIFFDIELDFQKLEGETIKKIETAKVNGSLYEHYILVTCESGKRVIFRGNNDINPEISLEEMRKTTFFTPEEIAEKVKYDEIERRERQRMEEMEKRQEFERLKKELGIE